LSKFARGIHPGVKFKETEPEPLQMSWETLTFNSSSAIAPLPLRTTCLLLKKESSLERRRKAESDMFFFYIPPKSFTEEKSKNRKNFCCRVLPFPKKKGTKLLTRILFPRQAQDAFTIETTGLRDYVPAKTARNERKTPRGMFFEWFRAIFLGRNRSQNAFSKIENDCIFDPSPQPIITFFCPQKDKKRGIRA
jgi:hypothetical protein